MKKTARGGLSFQHINAPAFSYPEKPKYQVAVITCLLMARTMPAPAAPVKRL